MKNTNTQAIVRVALFAALIAVLSQIAIPMPSGVPVTLQTFAIALTGYVLGCRRGPAAVAVFLALGAVGVPVFANFTGGFAKLVGVTGGFLWGFLPMAFLCGLGNARPKWEALLLGAAGLLVCHACGVVMFAAVAQSSLVRAALTVSIPYLVKDLLSVAAAFAAAQVIARALAHAHVAA